MHILDEYIQLETNLTMGCIYENTFYKHDNNFLFKNECYNKLHTRINYSNIVIIALPKKNPC